MSTPHPDPDNQGDDLESSPPPRPEERGGLSPPIRRPPTALGAGSADPSGRFRDRYQIERRLPWPSSWAAVIARDLTQDRLVVLRIPDPRFPNPSRQSKEFLKAIESATTLNHPNILSTLEFGETNDGPFLISPYLPGEWLHDRLQRERQLPVSCMGTLHQTTCF